MILNRWHFWTLDILPSTLDILPSLLDILPSTLDILPSTLDKNLHSLFGGQRREKMLDVVQNIRHVVFIFALLSLPEGGHFATDDFYTKKSRGPSTRSVAHLHFSRETTRISRECPEDCFKTGKNFPRETFQSEDGSSIAITSKIDKCIKRKILLSKTFQIHCSSSYAQVFHYFFFVVVLPKGGQRLLERHETQQISSPIGIR